MGSSCFMISCFIPGRTQDRLKIYIKQLVTRDTWWTQWPSEDHYICIQIPQTDFHWKPRKYACDEYCLLKSFFNPIFFHHPKSRIGSGIRILDWIFRIIMKRGQNISLSKEGSVALRGFIRNKKVASLLTSFRGGRLLHRHVAWEQNIRLRFPLNLNGERGDGMFLLLALNVIGVGQLPTKSRLRLPLFLNCWVKWLAFRADFSWVGLRRPSISIYWSRVDPPES